MSYSEPQPPVRPDAVVAVPPPPAPQQNGYSQPQYGQAPYGPTPGSYYAPDPATAKNWMNLTAMILGIAAMPTCGFTAIPAIVFGHLGLNAEKQGTANNRGLGLTGLIFGYVILGLSILVVAANFLIPLILYGVAATSTYGSY